MTARSSKTSTARLAPASARTSGRAWTAKRPSTEQCSAEVSGTAAEAGDDAPWRVFQRTEARTENPGLVQDLKGAFVAGDVQLVPRPALERTTTIGTNL